MFKNGYKQLNDQKDDFDDADGFENLEALTPEEVAELDKQVNYKLVAEDLSYSARLANTMTWAFKNSFVFGARYVGASFIAVTLVPKAVPHVARYFAPSAGVPGVMAATATVAFASGTVGLTGEASRKMAEGVWDVSSSFVGYMFSGPKQNLPLTVLSEQNLLEDRKTKKPKSRKNGQKLLA